MSNIKLILIFVAALLIIVFFGRSPMDEVRQRRAERAGRTLVTKIEEANTKNKNKTSVNGTNVSGNLGTQHNANTNGSNAFQRANPYNKQNPAPPANMGMPAATIPEPPKDNYYPPEPKNKNITPPISGLVDVNSAHKVASKALANPNTTTDDGIGLAFWGTKVYVYDDKGKLKPLPDGDYSMYDGKWTMRVRAGEQYIADVESANW